ncbi:MAG: hypothetical protein JW754_04220 [Candidatus Aenigmarchaeota archaeon]|nr:hypothetical protein [Candidatus Aenigmarchaeota archaeon]
MKKTSEGLIEFFVPEDSLTKKSNVFYNPVMEYQRDLTISCLKVAKPSEVLLPLAASGVRGARILKEVGCEKIVLNDANPSACKLMKKNLMLNKIPPKSYEIRNEDARKLMLENRYDYVDIDPFGSPIDFLRNIGFCVKDSSLLGVTATDSGALAGKFANACMRRYGVRTLTNDFPKELGVRVLITTVLRHLSANDMTFIPLYSHGNHYFRVMGRIERGATKTDQNLDKIEMISYCHKCLNRVIGFREKCKCGSRFSHIGPVWTGPTKDADFVKKALQEFFNSGFRNPKELQMTVEELDIPFYYDLHSICRRLRKSPPKMDKILEALKGEGYRASRTRFCLNGFRTDAGIKTIKKLVK